MLTPLIVDGIYHEHVYLAFVVAFLITAVTGFILWMPFRNYHYELRTRDGFFVVTFLWFVLSMFGAIPLWLNHYTHIGFTDAAFESVSGITTTGATVLTHLSDLPKSILYYRQQLHFLGGMGIIVLAVAIMPILGIGGMQLYRAEVVGPVKTSKFRPRIAQTAKSLWYIYVGLTAACALSYWACGLDFFDALGESFATVATGGFSLHETSFAFYKSTAVDVVAIIFMILGSCNFALHFYFLSSRKISTYWKDYELIVFLRIILLATVAISLYMVVGYHYSIVENPFHVLFTVVSLASTTGFTTVDFNQWPTFVPVLLMIIAMVGGCGGSTSGGIKVIRYLMVKEQGLREIRQLIHPNAVLSLNDGGGSKLPDKVLRSIWGFFSVYMFLFCFLILLLLATGMNLKTAFGALVVCIANTGASIGDVAQGFSHLHASEKWLLIFAMFLGRLEIFTVLVLFSPSYWRR
tara:strand:- start:3352 stop:4743 length:1392 start_codon:yes stop_codon:yes gene_type:complete